MPVTYTITAADVSSVDPDSLLAEGVVFNWTDSTITTPSTLVGIDGQWTVDNARFAEATLIGMARPSIVTAAGKEQIGVDPISGLPSFRGVLATLLDSWSIVSQRIAGQTFTILDVYKPDASLPYDSTVPADIIYRQTVNPTTNDINTSGGNFTATDATRLQELWATLISSGVFNAAAFANLVTGLTAAQALQLQELFDFRGLNAANPITGDDSNPNSKTETDGTVTITHTISGDTVTSQRSG